MDVQTGAKRPPLAPNLDRAHATQTNGLSNRRSSSAFSTPLSSAPATPSQQTPTRHRPPHPATSPLNAPSPNSARTVKRASSATNLHQRPTSSQSPKLVRKSSRTSLGGPPEENDKRPTPKRSISNLITGLREAQTKMESIEEPVPLTAPQIAVDHFARELNAHGQPDCAAETVVILHDACYGHRYSRLKATKSTLSMIVERPERIHASVLGASTAYVRLGSHHAGAKNAPHPHVTETASPPFKIRRTGRAMDITAPYVTNVHGTAWMSELRTMCAAAGEKIAAGAKELSRSATPTEPEKRKLHEGDLYLSSESLNAFQGALGGVADAVDAVFEPASHTKRAFVAIRPPGHHCSADYPSGFCWLNNVHVGIEYAAQTYGLTHAAILDFDLHHGDGSQAITWERNSKNNEKRSNAKPHSKLRLSPDIGYYSLHDINSYPCEMGDDEKVQAASLCIDNAHGQSIWNVHLEEWKDENEFWQLYEAKYRILLDKARRFLRHHTARLRTEGKAAPKAAVFISAGFDASEWEGAGMQRHKVNVPTEFYARFTRDVVELAQEEGTGCHGRVISVLEGGYSDRALCSGVLSHLSGLCATPIYAAKPESSTSVGLDEMMRGLGINGTANAASLRYDKSWWSAANLTALELKVNPPPPGQGKKIRTGLQPTYATPTESFAYKVVDTDRFARSISGTMRESARPARPPTPPPPDVDWVVATQELSKLLIPIDRQTRSCTPEELAGPKVKKERAGAVSATAAEDPGKPRQLRDRKARGPTYASSSHSDELESLRSVSRNSRRQTIADLPLSSDLPETALRRRASRRLSAGSNLSSITGDLDPAPPPVPAIPAAVPRTNGTMHPPTEPAAGLPVKKTRVPTKPKKAGFSSAPVSPARTTKAPATVNLPPTAAPLAAHNEVDALTSGVKKVTLKVGTKEEHDRKQKEKIDAERRARALKAAETRKVNAAAKKAAKDVPAPPARPAPEQVKAQTASPMRTAAKPEPLSGINGNAGILAAAPAPQPAGTRDVPMTVQAQAMPAERSDEPGPIARLETQRQDEIQADELSPDRHGPPPEQQGYFGQPPSPAIVDSSLPTGPDSAARQVVPENGVSNGKSSLSLAPGATWIKPSSSHQLPVWSSTGSIPFGRVSGHQEPPKSNVERSTDMAEFSTHADNGITETTSGAGDASFSAAEPKVEEDDRTIWDVPETPRALE
ncbi:histone deacetylase [Vermiconidia calcicola]|uniref:Histone deacetylase n=1 Tax=Vermiconidia calcicola TaxID=1690605 RepID=A0ACC3ME37_9PEZI|nr:histone deacetylase [Vermiconidia calcicola]